MANFTRAKPAGYGGNDPIASAEIEQIDAEHAKAVNGDEGGTYAGDLVWTGDHEHQGETTFTGEVQQLTIDNGMPTHVGASGEIVRTYAAKDQTVPGNATTTLITIPNWPGVRNVGKLHCELISVRYGGAHSEVPHFGEQVTSFVVRRAPASFLASKTEVIDQTSSGANLEHDIAVVDSSGDTVIQVVASATSQDCRCSLVVRAIDGPTFDASV